MRRMVMEPDPATGSGLVVIGLVMLTLAAVVALQAVRRRRHDRPRRPACCTRARSITPTADQVAVFTEEGGAYLLTVERLN